MEGSRRERTVSDKVMDFGGGKMEGFRRSSRMRGIAYCLALAMMVGMLMILQLPASSAPATTISPNGSAYITDTDSGKIEEVIEESEASTSYPNEETIAEPGERAVTLEELQDEVDELIENVEESMEDRTEVEKSLQKLLEEGDEVPAYTTPETGSTTEIPLSEQFRSATVLMDTMRERLSADTVQRLQALELQSIIGDCETSVTSTDLFKSDLEQRAESLDVDENAELKELWCTLHGNQKRDAMRAYIQRVQALNAPDEELQSIVQMEEEYEDYLNQREQDAYANEQTLAEAESLVEPS